MTADRSTHGLTVYLTLDDVLVAAQTALQGQRLVVRDHGLLASAVQRPAASVYGEDAYPSVLHKAAALVHSLVTNHALVDGNKPLGYTSLRLFLALNELTLVATEEEKVELIETIADGSLAGVEEIRAELTRLTTPTAGP